MAGEGEDHLVGTGFPSSTGIVGWVAMSCQPLLVDDVSANPRFARASAEAKTLGAKRIVPLPVSAPFHCPLMKPAQDRMKTDLDAANFSDLATPLVNDWQAREIRTGAEAREGLYQQIPNPVLWTASMKMLAGFGVAKWFEVGAGAVLGGLLKIIVPGAKAIPVGEAADIEEHHASLS